MRRRLTVIATLVAAVLAVGAGTSADAATQPVQLSNDGRTWAPDLDRPLFDPAVRWVPGDVRRATFWVRNAGPTVGSLTVTARVQDADGLLAEDAISLRMRTTAAAWTTVVPGTTASLGQLARNDRTQVEVTATFDSGSGDDTMRRTLHFVLDVRLAGATGAAATGPNAGHPPSAGSTAPGGGGLGGLLPNTGDPVTWWLCLLAALSLGGGAALVVRSKRRESE